MLQGDGKKERKGYIITILYYFHFHDHENEGLGKLTKTFLSSTFDTHSHTQGQ